MYQVTIVYDPQKKKLRGWSDDGIHGPAWVAFPNHLRQQDAVYNVSTMTWNGKNYKVVESGVVGRIR